MQTETTISAAPESVSPSSLASYLLTAERTLMGLVLVGCGVSGCYNVLAHPAAAQTAAQLSGAWLKAGFMLPLLKGAEVLLQLWANKARA
jgi:hypothetical protein